MKNAEAGVVRRLSCSGELTRLGSGAKSWSRGEAMSTADVVLKTRGGEVPLLMAALVSQFWWWKQPPRMRESNRWLQVQSLLASTVRENAHGHVQDICMYAIDIRIWQLVLFLHLNSLFFVHLVIMTSRNESQTRGDHFCN